MKTWLIPCVFLTSCFQQGGEEALVQVLEIPKAGNETTGVVQIGEKEFPYKILLEKNDTTISITLRCNTSGEAKKLFMCQVEKSNRKIPEVATCTKSNVHINLKNSGASTYYLNVAYEGSVASTGVLSPHPESLEVVMLSQPR